MITIDVKSNAKMLQNFNNEEYPDVTINLQQTKISLVLAYLSIDSNFFAELDPQQNQVDLSNFSEKYVIQVLRSLYGDELKAHSVSELEELYAVISYLQIEDYIKNIEFQIVHSKQLMQNLEILEFCFKHSLVFDELKQYHFETNLKALEDNRKFLQLNKISLQTLVPLLLEYYEKCGDSSNSIINNILQNYFNRNNIRPAQFFEEEDIEVLQSIWQQYHHSLQIIQRRNTTSSSNFNYTSLNKIKNAYSLGPQQTSSQQPNLIQKNKSNSVKEDKQLMEMKDARIQNLREEIQQKQLEINRLKEQLYDIKKISFPKKVSKRLPSIPVISMEDEQISILEGVKSSKRDQKHYEDNDNCVNEQGFRENKNSVKTSQHQKIHRF